MDHFIQTFIESTVEKTKLPVETRSGEVPRPIDFAPMIRDWVARYGFTPEEAKEQIDKWSADVERSQQDFYKLGLAAFAERNFSRAGDLFAEAGEVSAKQLKATERQQRDLEAKRDVLRRDTVRNYQREGDSKYSGSSFLSALTAYQKALSFTDRITSPELWAQTQVLIGIAHYEIGTRIEGPEANRNLVQAEAVLRASLEVYTRKQFPSDWATAQNNLGITLVQQGRRADHDVFDLLVQAEAAFRAALGVYKREQWPQAWAAAQGGLAGALKEQATRSAGEEGSHLLSQSMTADRAALEVYTREQPPQAWAMTQNNLGVALREQGTHNPGEEGRQSLALAVAADHAALEVETREQTPLAWAMTQNNLGNALSEQATRSWRQEGSILFAQAISAYRAALEVRTRDQLPQDWATTQTDLGSAFSGEGTRIGGEDGRQLLAQAVSAYNAALEVRSREQLPQAWAATQNNLGNTLSEQGARSKSRDGRALLARAASAYRATLEVRTREQLPKDWAMTQSNLGNVLREQGVRHAGQERRELLAQAVAAFLAALKVHTREQMPQDWAMTQNNLAMTYNALSEWSKAAECYRGVIEIHPDYEQAFRELTLICHEKLFDYTSAVALLHNWIQMHPKDIPSRAYLAGSLFTVGRFGEARAQLSDLKHNSIFQAPARSALWALEIAALVAEQQTVTATNQLHDLEEFISAQPASFKINAIWSGTIHFVQTDKRLLMSRRWLESLFQALQGENRDAVLASLRSLPSGIM